MSLQLETPQLSELGEQLPTDRGELATYQAILGQAAVASVDPEVKRQRYLETILGDDLITRGVARVIQGRLVV